MWFVRRLQGFECCISELRDGVVVDAGCTNLCLDVVDHCLLEVKLELRPFVALDRPVSPVDRGLGGGSLHGAGPWGSPR